MSRRRPGVDRMVEAVLAGEAIPAGELGPEGAEVLRAAIVLRAARPGAGVPSEEFLTRLRREIAAGSGIPRKAPPRRAARPEIGRASCRERVLYTV